MKKLIIVCLSVIIAGFAVIAADKFLRPLPLWVFALGWVLGLLGIISAAALFMLRAYRRSETGIIPMLLATSVGAFLAMLTVLDRKLAFLPEHLHTSVTLLSFASMVTGVLIGRFKNQHGKN